MYKLFYNNKLILLANIKIQNQYPYYLFYLPSNILILSQFKLWKNPINIDILEIKSSMRISILE